MVWLWHRKTDAHPTTAMTMDIPNFGARGDRRDGGRIYGPYSSRTFSRPTDTDIEHIVARSAAHDSGLCAADDATKRAFANDLLNITLAS